MGNMENIKIVVKLLKEHGIRHVVISPGGTNIAFVNEIQDDSFFLCYSVVDERSAVYVAIGIYLQTREKVATLCTSAQATRNYIPGLTEGFYKKVPILVISMQKHPRFKYQEYMQAPDQSSLPNDTVKKSFELPFVKDNHDIYHSIRLTNEAILELTRNGTAPVQLCIPWLDFEMDEHLPNIRKIERILPANISYMKLINKKILIVIGEHLPFTVEEEELIRIFCEKYNVVVYTNHLSNFSNEYSIFGNLLLSSISNNDFNNIAPDILITIGGQTGDYPLYHKLSGCRNTTMEHWRVCEDGKIADTYDSLTTIYQCSIKEFFVNFNFCPNSSEHSYIEQWNILNNKMVNNIKVPFSNIAIAQYFHDKIPANSIVQFSILNSLRCWNLFKLNNTIECYSNVGAFGIDGGMSTLIGQSMVTDKLSFMITGDLAFFYDMNSLGIRHIKNNIRILLINNNGGVEFKLHGGDNKKIDEFIAAGNHYKNAEGWSLTCGFTYLSAQTIQEIMQLSNRFLGNSDTPILLEVFVNDKNESDAYNLLIQQNQKKNTSQQIKKAIKSSLKNIVGDEKYKDLKNSFKSLKI